jgi:hypothetical protein
MRSRLILFAFCILSISASAQDACKDILGNGIWEIKTIKSAAEFQSQLYKFFSENKFSSRSSAKSASVGLGITIPTEIPINLDGTWGQSSNSSRFFSDAVVSELQNNQAFRKQYLEQNKTASEAIVAAWKGCMADRAIQGGILSTTKYIGTNKAQITLEFNPLIGVEEAPVINKTSLNNVLKEEGLILKGNLNENTTMVRGVLFRIDIEIPENELPKAKEITVSLNSNLYKQFQISLPRIVEKPVVWEEAVTPDTQRVVGAVSRTFTIRNRSNKFVKGELGFVMAMKSFDPGAKKANQFDNAKLAARAGIKIYDSNGKEIHSDSLVHRNWPRTEMAISTMPTRIILMEPGESKEIRVNVNPSDRATTISFAMMSVYFKY